MQVVHMCSELVGELPKGFFLSHVALHIILMQLYRETVNLIPELSKLSTVFIEISKIITHFALLPKNQVLILQLRLVPSKMANNLVVGIAKIWCELPNPYVSTLHPHAYSPYYHWPMYLAARHTSQSRTL